MKGFAPEGPLEAPSAGVVAGCDVAGSCEEEAAVPASARSGVS